MSDLSGQMLEAARANDWDGLCALEHEVASLRDHLVHEDPPALAVALDESTRQRKLALIRKILADDREIRAYAMPWMEDVKHLLSGGARKRAINQAYGMGPR
ncbi:MAG: flagellar protein FliT [Candidatus Dactylopiibacterium carminicum]|uniref:Flagellar protein FliT n=2 Tax=Candidatus Dactylopiibacterium carminicum TaxID=857335 RepID=A0A272EVH6_9RHOO|nr:flagellar protein FliT [Candidatus Dactylopiibacterium carminicum]PAS94119.1 MAG: flagellar protein FliT [Candidatus Dactylopiibacterium carminicum]PAS98218.1 MAG: flagellar protein FliT [Candidatus Dactylopiibacterium carminicum]